MIESTESLTGAVNTSNEVIGDIKEGTIVFTSKYAPRYISFYQYNGTELTEELSNLDISNITDMARMFYDCSHLKSLDLSNFNTSKVTSMERMFYTCSGMLSIDVSSFDTTNVTNMSVMFRNCTSLKSLDLSNFNTSKVSDFNAMFQNCKNLVSFDISNFDMSKAINIANMFNSCTNLTNLIFGRNLGKGYYNKWENTSNYKLDLSQCTLLTHDSLMSVINNIYDLNLTYDVVNGGTLYRQQLVLGTTNLAKLTEEEIAIATNKGWNVS